MWKFSLHESRRHLVRLVIIDWVSRSAGQSRTKAVRERRSPTNPPGVVLAWIGWGGLRVVGTERHVRALQQAHPGQREPL